MTNADQRRPVCAKYGCHALPHGDTIYCTDHHETWCGSLKIEAPKHHDCNCHDSGYDP